MHVYGSYKYSLGIGAGTLSTLSFLRQCFSLAHWTLSTLSFLRQCFSLAWNSPGQAGWTASPRALLLLCECWDCKYIPLGATTASFFCELLGSEAGAYACTVDLSLLEFSSQPSLWFSFQTLVSLKHKWTRVVWTSKHLLLTWTNRLRAVKVKP